MRKLKYKSGCAGGKEVTKMTTTSLCGLKMAWLWLMAVDWGDGRIYLTYKVGNKFLETVIHFN